MRFRSCALVLLLPLAVGTQTTAEATTVAETTEAPNATTVPFACSGAGSNFTLCELFGNFATPSRSFGSGQNT